MALYTTIHLHNVPAGREAEYAVWFDGPHRDALARLGFIQPHSATYTRHYLTNHVIEGTADGAIGKEYLAVLDIGENGASSSVFLGGHYEDVYAKAPEGWRIKKRMLYTAKTGPDANAAPAR